MAIDPNDVDENGNPLVVHFVGLWEEPTYEVFMELEKEIKTEPEFGLVEIAHRIDVLHASPEVIDFYNIQVAKHEARNN